MTAALTRRLLAPAAALAAATAFLVPAGSAEARAASVTVANMAFSPAAVGTTLGGTVTWSFQDPFNHTSTSDQGFWDSGSRSSGATYTHTFTSAGTFSYHCTIHSMMHGTVKVPLTASGAPSKGFRLTWATVRGSGPITYDVQTRRGTGAWVWLRKATTSGHAHFDPATAGRYAVRARTGKGAARSGWSPTVTVTIS